MTTVQKVIKYLATAFAIFLIVTIISAILGGVYGLAGTLGLIHKNEEMITEDLKEISDEVGEVSTLKLDLAFTNLEIKTGDMFKVETNNSRIAFSENNGSVVIKEEENSWWKNGNYVSDLIIYIPEDTAGFDEVNIECGAGNVKIESLVTQGLRLNGGAGDVHIENLVVTKEADIDGGAGNVTISSGEINDLDFDLGVGETSLTASLNGKSDIDSGIGNLNITLLGDKENYQIEIDKGLGNVSLDGENLDMNRVYGTGENYIEIDGGIGNIEVEFRS